ncbi:FecCD family ABC transporter permease [Lacticaseibacillus manihotivorans]|uniref:Ferrichrome ABC transporter permease n=2 Tax=Lacticaseibacillus manihotivorans TaxID=88233 RepID=A0A0R1QHZ4_9LACO|nr:iron ABC transporter permease [Lacticaseibacillus manihotivorans]KRL44415.1 ferrichrome ABC transporter permease [Lacticaseibacillus manihotivorans DSM 13343 = JCM 12514]QFQ92158.1 iron chelate uptake ABC transporter family permease subunit [Lacticaseibacillus manihotivorans]
MKTFTRYLIVIALALLATFACLMFGDIHLSLSQVLNALFGLGDHVSTLVIWQMRLPYVFAALICGSALAVSGLLLQQLTQNPLVDSSILGVNAGASLGAVLLIALSARYKALSVQTWLPLAAILGAGCALVLVQQTNAQHDRLRLLLRGVALTALLNGVILMLQLNMNSFDFERVLTWLTGSFWNVDGKFLAGYGLAAVVLLLLVWWFRADFNMLNLGDDMAQAAGVNINRTKRLLMSLAIALAAVAVAVGGAIALIGLMSPNIAKRLVGSQFTTRFAMSILVGCTLMLASNTVANNLFLPATLPVGLVVAVITMPYFLMLLFQKSEV